MTKKQVPISAAAAAAVETATELLALTRFIAQDPTNAATAAAEASTELLALTQSINILSLVESETSAQSLVVRTPSNSTVSVEKTKSQKRTQRRKEERKRAAKKNRERDTGAELAIIPTPSNALVTIKKTKGEKRKENRVRDIVAEFDIYFGSDDVLENWKRLCKDVGVANWEELPSITQCKKALKGIWVNIYDLLDAVKADKCPPRRFVSENSLSRYSKDTKRIYPKEDAKEEGPVRALLARIFRYGRS